MRDLFLLVSNDQGVTLPPLVTRQEYGFIDLYPASLLSRHPAP